MSSRQGHGVANEVNGGLLEAEPRSGGSKKDHRLCPPCARSRVEGAESPHQAFHFGLRMMPCRRPAAQLMSERAQSHRSVTLGNGIAVWVEVSSFQLQLGLWESGSPHCADSCSGWTIQAASVESFASPELRLQDTRCALGHRLLVHLRHGVPP